MNRSIRSIVAAGMLGLAAPLLAVTTASAAPTTSSTATTSTTTTAAAKAAASSSSSHITVPSNYVYNPKTKYQTSLHDYCTKSPDEFPIYGKNANFRGPCARHDMCIQYKQHYRFVCDANLLTNMYSECQYTYGTFDPRRGACKTTAKVYWAVVTAKTIHLI